MEEKNSNATCLAKWWWLCCTYRADENREEWRHRKRMSKTCCTAEDYWWDICQNGFAYSKHIGMITHMGQVRVSRGVLWCPIPNVVGLQYPKKFLEPPTYTQMVWPRATEFGVINMWCSMFLRVTHARMLMEQGPAFPKFLEHRVRAHITRIDNKILHDY